MESCSILGFGHSRTATVSWMEPISELGDTGLPRLLLCAFFGLHLALFILGHSDLHKEPDSGSQAHGSDFAASSTPLFLWLLVLFTFVTL